MSAWRCGISASCSTDANLAGIYIFMVCFHMACSTVNKAQAREQAHA